METRYINETKRALAQLENMRASKAERLLELDDYSDSSLKASCGRKKKYYYVKRKGEKAYTYLGDDSNQDVRSIREYRFLSRLIGDIDSEIELLRMLHDGHLELDFDSVNERLAGVYRNPLMKDPKARLSDAAKRWKHEKENIKSRFEPRNPDNLIMKAIDGTLMRSKSEVIIANLLISNGIPFVYELPHIIKGSEIHADFTALSTIDYRTEVIIEHEGMMAYYDYQKTYLFKVNTYLSAGIIPGRDVFFTFDDLHGGFDPSPVQDIIDTRLKPCPWKTF